MPKQPRISRSADRRSHFISEPSASTGSNRPRGRSPARRLSSSELSSSSTLWQSSFELPKRSASPVASTATPTRSASPVPSYPGQKPAFLLVSLPSGETFIAPPVDPPSPISQEETSGLYRTVSNFSLRSFNNSESFWEEHHEFGDSVAAVAACEDAEMSLHLRDLLALDAAERRRSLLLSTPSSEAEGSAGYFGLEEASASSSSETTAGATEDLSMDLILDILLNNVQMPSAPTEETVEETENLFDQFLQVQEM